MTSDPHQAQISSVPLPENPPASDSVDDGKPAATRDALQRIHFRHLLRGTGACLFSMLVHVIILLVLGLIVIPISSSTPIEPIVSEVIPEELEKDNLKVELDPDRKPLDDLDPNQISSAPAVGLPTSSAGGGASATNTIELDQQVVMESDSQEIAIENLAFSLPPSETLLTHLPSGTFGDPRQIVDNYQQAMDRITQEIMWMLDKRDVMVIWCFDQSKSMEDDRQEIRERVERVYQELGLSDKANGKHLLTAVTSFGNGFLNHTPKPTSNLDRIRQAIDSVPNDPSGKEMLCQAVGNAVRLHRDYARGGRYQLVLIVVTDESGDPESNNRYLELAISEAKAANCKTYVLGREAVFGYPYAYMSWRHPQTNRVHWLQIDRGPETAFVEQLQTNGFRRRQDAFSSGFGPYEQTRLARETSGVFFMLPSVESRLVRGNVDKRRYELEALRAYLPDMRSRLEQLEERKNDPLKSLIWQVIYDLNPYNAQVAKIIEVRMSFSLNPAQFVRQARTEQAKAKVYLQYLHRAEIAMQEAAELREKETSPRWQANYDLIYAQIIAYQARIYEYGAYLEGFMRKPKLVPLTKGPNTKLVNWDITTRKQLVAESVSQPYIDKATMMFQQVIKNNPGTPWAARAQAELARGFGIDLIPDYDSTLRSRSRTITGPLQPIPKL
jgi:hypothetical protein